MNVINLPQHKNYAYCADCEGQTWFMILDDDENLVESECATCRIASELEVDVVGFEFIPECDCVPGRECDHYHKEDEIYP